MGLDHRWNALVCANEEPTRDKAELYQCALAVLDVPASEALAFEDSPAGVRAAKQVGIFCVAVPSEITRGASFDEADAVISSLADQPLDALLRMVDRS